MHTKIMVGIKLKVHLGDLGISGRKKYESGGLNWYRSSDGSV
jgi:hypothetical protein